MSTKLKSLVSGLALVGLVGGVLVFTTQEARAHDSTYQAKNMFAFGNPADLVADYARLFL